MCSFTSNNCRYDEALELLDSMIEDDETNASPRKRKIAILKAKGRTVEAIKELNEYLKKYVLINLSTLNMSNDFLATFSFDVHC